ncbi:hypothetical protein ACMFMF_007652 [Clarireedia jacksonii]
MARYGRLLTDSKQDIYSGERGKARTDVDDRIALMYRTFKFPLPRNPSRKGVQLNDRILPRIGLEYWSLDRRANESRKAKRYRGDGGVSVDVDAYCGARGRT